MAINVGGLFAELQLKADGFFTTIDKADKSMGQLESKMKVYGGKMTKAGVGLTAGLTVPIVGIGAAAMGTAMGFEQAMSEVRAISGATGDEFKALEDKAKEMGANTKFSASDSAEALNYMAMAGWDSEKMMGGLEGVMNLAAASGEELGSVSDIVTDAMTAFGKEADYASSFADILAAASSSANTNVGMMGETFKYAAPVAGALGYSVEDTALAISLMANAGIKGSQAGTSLRSILSELGNEVSISSSKLGDINIATQDTDGNMRGLAVVISDLRSIWPELTDAEKAQNAEMIAGKNAMSGFLALMGGSDQDFKKLQGNIENSTGRAKEMADVMQDNVKGEFEQLKSAVEGLAIEAGQHLLPIASDLVGRATDLVRWFSELDDTTKKNIGNVIKFAAAAGPLLIVGGKLTSGLGSIIGLVGKFGLAAKGATTATAALGGVGGTGAVGGLTAAFGASVGAVLPWGVALAGAGLAAKEIHDHLKERTIPAVDLFGEGVSENTAKALGGFLDLERDATVSLNNLAWSGTTVSNEMSSSLIEKFGEMADGVVGELERQKREGLIEIEKLFSGSKTMTDEEKTESIRLLNEKYSGMIEETTNGNAAIKEILSTAASENRALTAAEEKEIGEIKGRMKETGIRVLSETETESLLIIERLKQQSGEITAEMASEVVKNSLDQKTQAIENAKKEYDERLRFAATLRADGSKESNELADKVIKEAERQMKDSIKAAEEMHKKVVSAAKEQAKDHVEQINWETGEIKTKWDELKNWFKTNPIIRSITTFFKDDKTHLEAERNDRLYPMGRNASGTDFWMGGRTWVGEYGPEIIELPRGSKVHSNETSMSMVGASQARKEVNVTLNIGTLIGDDTGLKKLERKLRDIRISEDGRLGI